MASSSFTTNLGLCNWSADDSPKRADFVSDNQIIDDRLGGHLSDASVHLTAAEKQKVQTPYASQLYAGDGTAQRSFTAAFAPRFAVVYKRGAAPVSNDNGVSVVNSAVAYYGAGGSSGLELSSTGFTVRQDDTASGGVRRNLNENGVQYTAVLFR